MADYRGRKRRVYCGVKLRIYPNKSRERAMDEIFDRVDAVYDRLIEGGIKYKKKRGRYPTQDELSKAVETTTRSRDELDFLLPDVMPGVIEAAERAFRDAERGQQITLRSEKPYRHRSFTTKGNKGDKPAIVDRKHLYIPRLGKVKAVVHRNPMEILSVTVSKERDGRYYASLLVPRPDSWNPKRTDNGGRVALALSLGTEAYIELSGEGPKPAPQAWERNLERLRAEEAKLVSLERGSEEYERQRLRLARLHAHIASIRRDWLHKLSDELTRDYDVIVVPKGDVADAMKELGSSDLITDAAWSELVRQLEYKSRWRGKRLFKVDAEIVEVDGRPVLQPKEG